MDQAQHTPTLASLEEALTLLFCLIDDAYALLNPRGQSHASLKKLSDSEVAWRIENAWRIEKLPYVSGVKSTFGVRLPEEVRAAKEAGAPPYRGRGQPPKERPAPLYTAKELIGSLPEEAWRTIAWREGTKGTLSKQIVAVRAHRATGSDRHSTTHKRVLTAVEGWLIAEGPLRWSEKRKDLPGEEEELKYYYSSLGADVSLERLVALVKSRWAIEQFYEDGKGECGLGDYQGRRWDGLHRHLARSMVAYSFLMVLSCVLLGEDPSHEEEEAFSPLQSG